MAVTPNGYADGLLEANNTTYFVTPEEVPMTIAKFIDLLNKPRLMRLYRQYKEID